MIDAVVFDLFETLITESTLLPIRASSLGDRLGLESDAFRAEWRLRRSRVVLGQLSFGEALAEICRTLTGSVDMNVVHRLCEERAAQKAAAFTHRSDEVAALISGLADRHVALGVISNCFQEDVRAWTAWPLARKFRCVMFSFAERVAKPDPEIYRRAVRRLGAQPATTLFVGDGGDNELVGAERAGLRPLRATWFAADRHPRRSEIVVVDVASPKDMLTLVASG